jgi:hypothetical protein
MKRTDQVKVVNYLSAAVGGISVALEAAARGDREAIEKAIKETFYGLDNAIYIARDRPQGDVEEHPLSTYITPIPPELASTHDTILGWMAKNNPSRLLEEMYNPLEDTKRDGFHLSARATREGVIPPKVPACQALKDHGITEVNAYPIQWIKERCGG